MPQKTENIHEGHRARVRKSYIERGDLNGMHEHEILEMLLFYAYRRCDVNKRAHELINRFGSLKGVLSASIEELRAAGLNETTAVLLKLTGDIGKRIDRKKSGESVIRTTDDAIRACHGLLFREESEVFAVICLNVNKRVVRIATQTSGMSGRVAALPKWVVDCAISSNASAVVLAHNHPSGDVMPSNADRETTAMLERLLDSLGIAMYDNIVVTHNAGYSMRRDYTLAIEPEAEASNEANGVEAV